MTRKICAIVGAGEGLGQALSAKFAEKGFDLALISRTEAGSAAAKLSAIAAGGKARFFAADATKPETVEVALEQVTEELGPPEVLIYNARGVFKACEPLEMTYEALEQSFRLEVVGAFAAAKSVLPSMRTKGQGSLLFSSATAAFRGSANHPLYAIGKFGLRALTQSLAKAYAADGVHVAHIRLDCDLISPVMRDLYGDAYDPTTLAAPADVAEAYWWLHTQPKGAWSNEIDLRPHTEGWTI